MRRLSRPLFALALVACPIVIAAAGCDATTAGCTAVVGPSSSASMNRSAIQAALEKATPGAQICLRPGTYKVDNELTLSMDNVTIRGTGAAQDATILDFAGQTGAHGINVVSVAKFKIANLTVKNSAGDAIKVTQSDDVTFDHVTVTWDRGRDTQNGAYGLYPVQCTRVLIANCHVSYAADAGIYVGQSNTILVRDSEADGNVAGIEIENSSDAEVINNYAHDNTAGILVFNLPELMMKTGARTKVHKNRMVKNNGENFAAKSGIVSVVPPGTGLLVMASKNSEFHDNDITDNDSVGVAIVSFYVTQRKWNDMSYDPVPDTNYVHDNRMSNNGMSATGLANNIKLAAGYKTVPDLVWDGIVDPAKKNVNNAITNCFKDNGAATFGNLNIDDMGNFHPSMDIGPVTCSHDPLPPIVL